MRESVPYSEYVWPSLDEGTVDGTPGKSATYVPASYERRVREAQAYHTGSPDRYLTIEESKL
jgi:hypothetical protein